MPSYIKTALFLFVLVMLVFAPVTYLHAYDKIASDFDHHQVFALSLAKDGPDSIPTWVLAHAGWQVVLLVIRRLLHSSFEFAGLFVALFFTELTALFFLFWYQPVLSKMNWQGWKACLVILGVCVAAPVSLLWPLDHLMYLGYIGITSYHNPTMIMLRPFAMAQFVFAYQCFHESAVIKNWHVGLVALLALLGTFVKPSLAICILPAVAMFAAYRILKHQYLNYKGLILGLGLPMGIVLAWQFVLAYYAAETDAVIFLPFVVMSGLSKYLGWKLFLSMLFPLALLIGHFSEMIRDPRMILAWLIFFWGLVFTYLFAESGPRLLHGNFGWSGEIALLLLFAASTLFYLEKVSTQPTKSAKLLAGLWSLHVVFGVIYYLYNMFYRSYS